MAIDHTTGEITEAGKDPQALPEPETLEEVNAQINVLTAALGRNNRERTRLLKEQAPVDRHYVAIYNAAVASSRETSADMRKADAMVEVHKATVPEFRDVLNEAGDPEWPDGHPYAGRPLEETKQVLKMRLGIQKDLGHDLRVVLNGLQSTGSNLRTVYSATMYGGGSNGSRP